MLLHPLVVFDLDGTLVDSRHDLAAATNELLESYGASALPLETIVGMVGDGAGVLIRKALAAVGHPLAPDARERWSAIYDRRLLDHTRPYGGIELVVERAAARATLAVLTNKPENPTRRLLKAFALDRFIPHVIGGDSGWPRKPDPAGLLELIRRVTGSSSTTLFIGDSMVDVETARRAQVAICFAAYGFGHARGDLDLRGDERRAQ